MNNHTATGDQGILSGQALLVADTDTTQAYVFESNKLPEIRGASRQLDDLNEEIGGFIKDGNCIYASGGGLLAYVEANQATALVEKIEALYPKRTGVATITADWRSPPNNVAFGQVVRWAGHWLRHKKESKYAPPFFESLPYQVRCKSCQKRAASVNTIPDWPLCMICYNKRLYMKKPRQDNKQLPESWFDRFHKRITRRRTWGACYYKNHEPQKGIELPQAIDEIAQASLGNKDYVAFIYLDGDGIGQLLQSLEDKADFSKISRFLTRITSDAVYKAIATQLSPTSVSPSETRLELSPHKQLSDEIVVHPFEIITIGGDDVLLIVPAHAAIPIATDIIRIFTKRLSTIAKGITKKAQDVTMSAGIVIAELHVPIRMMVDLSKQLLSSAKKAGGGCVDFHVLKTPDTLHRHISTVRTHSPYSLHDYKNKKLRLLGRPYGYAPLTVLWEHLIKLKKQSFSGSQIHLLAESLLEGRAASTLFYEYQRQREISQSTNAYPILHELLKQCQGVGVLDPLPWKVIKDDEDYSHQTILWDVAELYDFVPTNIKVCHD